MELALRDFCDCDRRSFSWISVGKIFLNIIRTGSGSYTSDTYFRKVMNIFANHPKCPLKAPVFEVINGKE